MARTRETKITLPCSQAQKTEVEQRAREQQLSVSNYLRLLLGWPLEQQGRRKDLMPTHSDTTSQESAPVTSSHNAANASDLLLSKSILLGKHEGAEWEKLLTTIKENRQADDAEAAG